MPSILAMPESGCALKISSFDIGLLFASYSLEDVDLTFRAY